MNNSKSQIVATIGPVSSSREVLKAMLEHGVDVIRINFSWADEGTRVQQISLIRDLGKEIRRHIPIIQDLPGPRIQTGREHGYDAGSISAITDRDEEYINFGAEQGLDYTAVSFVGGASDVLKAKELVKKYSGKQKVVAKIERSVAVDNIDSIIAVADAIMIARGDLGNEVPLEKIPEIELEIIKRCKSAGKPVITATQMMMSMVDHAVPTRADVTDVDYAVLNGSDAVMLSEESAIGKYPVETVTMMEKILVEAEKQVGEKLSVNQL